MKSTILVLSRPGAFWRYVLFLGVFTFSWLFLSNYASQHHPKEVFDYKSEITADKSGYYVYFPATFIYGYDASNFPNDIDMKTGSGFKLDTVNNKVFTKYTSGVAILTSPFFIATHLYQKATGNVASGFTKPYFKTANYAGVFYFLVGIIFLYLFLINFYKASSVSLTLLLTLLITHLFYYSIIDTLMSHVYTFSLFAMLLWAMNKYMLVRKQKHLIFISIIVGFILLIRPINILFVGIVFFVNVNSFSELKAKTRLFFTWKNVLILSLIVFVLFIPQLCYYKYLSGSYFLNTYKGEGFTNLFSPKFKEVLFSPVNGLIPYTPGFVFFVLSFLFLIYRKNINGVVGLLAFSLMIYISASWWAWSWGCSFSMRPMVDVLPILVVPFCAMIDWIYQAKQVLLGCLASLLFVYFAYFNVTFSTNYDHCFEGGEWEWKEYNKILRKARVFPFTTDAYRSRFDKEVSSKVRIMTQKGGYLKFSSDGEITQTPKGVALKENHSFFKIDLNENNIALKCINSFYLASDQSLKGKCIANRNEIENWEIFKVHSMADGYMVLENSEGKFLNFDSRTNQFLTGETSIKDSALLLKFEYMK